MSVFKFLANLARSVNDNSDEYAARESARQVCWNCRYLGFDEEIEHYTCLKGKIFAYEPKCSAGKLKKVGCSEFSE